YYRQRKRSCSGSRPASTCFSSATDITSSGRCQCTRSGGGSGSGFSAIFNGRIVGRYAAYCAQNQRSVFLALKAADGGSEWEVSSSRCKGSHSGRYPTHF